MMEGLALSGRLKLQLWQRPRSVGASWDQSPGCISVPVPRRPVPWSECRCKVPCYACQNSIHMSGFPCRLGCRVGMGSSRPGSLPARGRPHRRRDSSRRPRSRTLAH